MIFLILRFGTVDTDSFLQTPSDVYNQARPAVASILLGYSETKTPAEISPFLRLRTVSWVLIRSQALSHVTSYK